jgi:hypothetical protein
MRKWTASALIVLFLAASLAYLGHAGDSARHGSNACGVFDPALPVHVANTSAEVYSLWKDRGFHGRVVLHIGRYLHFVGVDVGEVYGGIDVFPVRTKGLMREYERRIDAENFLWIALQANIARELINVLPAEVFAAKLSALEGVRGVAVTGDSIVTSHFGSRRTITSGVAASAEPVLINIDASYFGHSDGAGLLEQLKSSGLSADMISLCLSMDNPEVTGAERDALINFRKNLARTFYE